jgi:2-iminobutanoate/2-iminopropanoate deaminase
LKKEVILPPGASADAPYSPAVRAGGFLFLAGAVGVNPRTKEIAAGDAAAQTRQAMENVKDVLEAGGSSLERVVKVQVFLTQAGDFQDMNSVFRAYFPSEPPARTTVVVKELVAKEMLVEIDVVALA